MEKIGAREDQAWINCHKPSKSRYLPILIPVSIKLIVYKSNSKLVTPYPRLQGWNVMYNRTDDSAGKSSLLWVYPVGSLPVFALFLILSVIFFILLLIHSVVCPKAFTFFSFLNFFYCIHGLLLYTVVYNNLYTRVAL